MTALLYLTDWPREARWLQPEERDWITLELESETKASNRIWRSRNACQIV
jgi:hypothetical protein